MSTENTDIFDEDFNMFSEIADDLAAIQESSQEEQEDDGQGIDPINKEEQGQDQSINEIDQDIKEESTEEPTEENNEETDDNSEDTASQETQTSPFTPYAKFLVEEGILSNLDLDNFDGTAESLKEAQASEISNQINAYKDSLPNEVKYLVDNYEAGVPFDKILNISSKQIQYESIKEESISENEDLQKDLVREYYKKTTKLSDDKIEKQISRLSDLSELEDEAKSSRSELIELQKQDAILEQQKAESDRNKMIEAQQQEIESLNKFLNDTDEIIPNVKMPKQIKDKIKSNLTTPVAQDEYGNPVNKVGLYRSQNPIKFEVILNYLYEATNEFKDWGVLGKAGKRSALRELEDAARSIDSRSANSSSSGSSVSSKGGSKGLMDAISGIQF